MKPEQVNEIKHKGLKFHMPSRRLLIIIIITVLLIASGLYLNGIRLSRGIARMQSLPLSTQKYVYTRMEDYKLPGEKNGSGITFSKPVEISSPDVVSDIRLQQNSFWHPSTNNGRVINIANMAVASAYTKEPPTQEYIQNLNEEANDSKNKSLIGSKASIKVFLEQRMPGYTAILKQPKPLITDKLKNNAWTIEFTAKAATAKDKNRLPDIKGIGVMALGTTTYYYMLINTVDYNWDANQQTWQKVLNSIKIDQ